MVKRLGKSAVFAISHDVNWSGTLGCSRTLPKKQRRVLNLLRVHSYRMSIVMEGESFVDICLVRGVMMVRV